AEVGTERVGVRGLLGGLPGQLDGLGADPVGGAAPTAAGCRAAGRATGGGAVAGVSTRRTAHRTHTYRLSYAVVRCGPRVDRADGAWSPRGGTAATSCCTSAVRACRVRAAGGTSAARDAVRGY